MPHKRPCDSSVTRPVIARPGVCVPTEFHDVIIVVTAFFHAPATWQSCIRASRGLERPQPWAKGRFIIRDAGRPGESCIVDGSFRRKPAGIEQPHKMNHWKKAPDPVVVPPPAPTSCPYCRSPRIVTTGEKVDASSYWRCQACGEMWNLGRSQAQHRYR